MVAQLIIKAAIAAISIGMNLARKIEGPRIDDPKVTVGDYGAPWPRVWGTRWMRPPVFWAKDLTVVRTRRKTKAGKYAEDVAYGDWACGLAIHELAGVRRIKFDGHLVYDVTGAGPVTPFDFSSPSGSGKGTTGGGSITDFLAFYPGTFAQEVDPVIRADIEAKHGEGACPAYLGRSYARFHMVPLEKFGNRIPQVEMEVASVVNPVIPTENKPTDISTNSFASFRFSPDFARFAWTDGSNFAVWDTAARAQMISGALPAGFAAEPGGMIGCYDDGRLLMCQHFTGDVYAIAGDGTTVALVCDVAVEQYGVTVVKDGTGAEHWGTQPFSFNTAWYFDGAEYSPGWQACQYFTDAHGNVWVAGRTATAGTTIAHFLRLVTVDNAPGYLSEFALTMPAASASSDGEGLYALATGDQFLLRWEAVNYLVDAVAGAIVATVPATAEGSILSRRAVWNNYLPGASTIWLGNSEYETATGALVRTVSSVPVSAGNYPAVYDPINHALIAAQSGLTWYYLDRLDSVGVTLGEVVSDVCALAGIDPATIDVSALTETITGYSVTGGSGKDWLEPLLDLHDVDPRPHGFMLEFLPRGSAAVGSIDSDTFAAADGAAPLFTTTRSGGTDLPMQVTLQFADVATEQQPGLAASPPLFDGLSQRIQTLDLSTLAMSVDEARQLIGRYARRQRFEAKPITLALTAQQIALEPGDVTTLSLRGVSTAARLQSLALGGDRRITTEWRRDDTSVHTLDASVGAVADGHRDAVVPVPLLSKGFVLDVPLLDDSDASANPRVYIAAAPYAAGTWPGATVYRQTGGEYSDEIGSVSASDQAVWGYATDVLGDANPNLWDRLGSVNVKLQVGSLTGTTEAAIDIDPRKNQALLGDEILNFATATLEGDGSYTLTGLKRGRRGTEWATGSHGSRDVFLLLSGATAEDEGLSDVGVDQSFKAITSGRTEGGTLPIGLEPFTGASLKPYAPCHLTATKDAGTGDWTLAWMRRTRVGGAWTSGTPIPLSEASEAYVVEILNGGSVVRTITGLSTPSATWTAAQQTSDFGSGQSTVTFRVHQVSDAVGRGFPALATV